MLHGETAARSFILSQIKSFTVEMVTVFEIKWLHLGNYGIIEHKVPSTLGFALGLGDGYIPQSLIVMTITLSFARQFKGECLSNT